MAISDSQKIDLLWKKIGFSRVKTDTNANKKAPNESINSKFIIDPTSIWAEASTIPGTIPSSNTSTVQVYTTLETTEDATSTARRTWLSGTVNWIPPAFGSTYQLKVYSATAGSVNPASSGTQLFETGSGNNDEWYFDYQSGVLHFIGSNLPSSVTSGKSIFITGAVYVGNLGLGSFSISNSSIITSTIQDSTISNTSITDGTLSNTIIASLATPLETKDGGLGITTFTENGVFTASNTSTVTFVTGTEGQVLQYDANGTPIANGIDGGNY